MLRTARSGEPYALFEGRQLNSSYDPRREAVRFVNEHLSGESLSTVMLLGDTLPYVRQTLRSRNPALRVVSVFYDAVFAAMTAEEGGPDFQSRFETAVTATEAVGAEGLRVELAGALREIDIDGIAIVEWPPSASAFPELSARVNTVVVDTVRELSRNLATSVGFCRRWLHNSFVNYLSIEHLVGYPLTDLPVVIAASGPSLDETLSLLSRHRAGYFLIALPSSLLSLLDAQIEPDVVVATDAGYWAELNVASLRGHGSVPVAMPLTAARGVWRSSSPVVLLSEGSFLETSILGRDFPSQYVVSPGGTVASTALELAERFSAGPIILAGPDLAFHDIREHARPHPFEIYFDRSSHRLRPLYSLLAARSMEATSSLPPNKLTSGTRSAAWPLRSSQALSDYAGWLGRRPYRFPTFRLSPAGAVIPGMVELGPDGFRGLLRKGGTERTGIGLMPLPLFRAERTKRLKTLLGQWRSRLRSARSEARTDDGVYRIFLNPPLFELLWSLNAPACLELHASLRAERGRSPGSDRSPSERFADLVRSTEELLEALEARCLQ